MSESPVAAQILDGLRTRGAIKRWAARLDQDEGGDLRRAIVREAVSRGVPLPDEAVDWPAKKLLRLARGRSAEAVARRTPVHRDESFTCLHCGRSVPAAGRTARDHCPWCLRSQHLDVVPGDRAAGCGGRMDPVSLEVRGGQTLLHYRCARCGHEHRVRALTDVEVPDDPGALRALSRGDLP